MHRTQVGLRTFPTFGVQILDHIMDHIILDHIIDGALSQSNGAICKSDQSESELKASV